MFKRKCWWCGNTFETEDVEENYCSMECFHADEDYQLIILEDDYWR